MNFYIISQVMISIFSSLGFVLVLRESPRLQLIGTVCGCIGVPFWWYTIFHTQMWYTLPIHTLYTWAWADKLWRLLKPCKEELGFETTKSRQQRHRAIALRVALRDRD